MLLQLCVGSTGAENFRTWEQITRDLGHHHRVLDVFKVDIEGYEPGLLAELRHDTPLPRQVVIEIHMLPNATVRLANTAPRTPAQLAVLMMHMASLGYGVVGQEDNIWGYPGCCAEWTFLHVERAWAGPGMRMSRLHSKHHKALGTESSNKTLQHSRNSSSGRHT